jgi:hypothetical protein
VNFLLFPPFTPSEHSTIHHASKGALGKSTRTTCVYRIASFSHTPPHTHAHTSSYPCTHLLTPMQHLLTPMHAHTSSHPCTHLLTPMHTPPPPTHTHPSHTLTPHIHSTHTLTPTHIHSHSPPHTSHVSPTHPHTHVPFIPHAPQYHTHTNITVGQILSCIVEGSGPQILIEGSSSLLCGT